MTHVSELDTCGAVTKVIVESARGRLDTSEDQKEEKQGMKETESVRSAASDKISINTKSPIHSRNSSRATSRQNAAAEVAANEGTLEVLLEQERHIEELQRLEAEAADVKAKQEAEKH